MEKLAALMKVRIRRPDPGNAMAGALIAGRRGDICKDGDGYSVALMFRHGKTLNSALAKLSFATVRQLGDTEAVVHIPALPTREQAETLRTLLRVKKIREYDAETLDRLRQRGRALRALAS